MKYVLKIKFSSSDSISGLSVEKAEDNYYSDTLENILNYLSSIHVLGFNSFIQNIYSNNSPELEQWYVLNKNHLIKENNCEKIKSIY